MRTAVRRWGNSLALRIPSAFAAETRIREGSEVEVSLNSGALVIRAVSRKRHALEALLKRITPNNRHAEISSGTPIGREIW